VEGAKGIEVRRMAEKAKEMTLAWLLIRGKNEDLHLDRLLSFNIPALINKRGQGEFKLQVHHVNF
jgi:hypothetical protein